jgi:hypothetical protein
VQPAVPRLSDPRAPADRPHLLRHSAAHMRKQGNAWNPGNQTKILKYSQSFSVQETLWSYFFSNGHCPGK